MKKTELTIALLLCIAVSALSCAGVFGKWKEPEPAAVVVDAETGEPVEGTVGLAVWWGEGAVGAFEVVAVWRLQNGWRHVCQMRKEGFILTTSGDGASSKQICLCTNAGMSAGISTVYSSLSENPATSMILTKRTESSG